MAALDAAPPDALEGAAALDAFDAALDVDGDGGDGEESEPWPELADVGPATKTLILRKRAAFAPHRFVDAALGSAASLTLLDVSGAGLERCDHVGNLANLRDLSLAGNALGPALAPRRALEGLGALRSLDLSANGLAVLPPSLAALEALESLDVSGNALAALRLVDLACLPRLRRAAFADNRLAALEAADHGVRELDLAGNALATLAGLAGSAELSALDASRNALAAPPERLLALCPKLKAARLGGNPWADRKFARACEAGGKATMDALRGGASKRRAKRAAAAAAPRPARLYEGAGPRKLVLATRAAVVRRPPAAACVLRVARRGGGPARFAFAAAETAAHDDGAAAAFEARCGLAARGLDGGDDAAVAAAGRRLRAFLDAQAAAHAGVGQGGKRVRNSQLQRLLSRPFSTRFG